MIITGGYQHMKTYPFTESSNGKVFKFLSTGPKGVIHKVVQFQKTDADILYNAALADDISGVLHFERESNNSDIIIILNTLAAIIERFCFLYPGSIIFLKGNNKQRNTIYQWRIKRVLQATGKL